MKWNQWARCVGGLSAAGAMLLTCGLARGAEEKTQPGSATVEIAAADDQPNPAPVEKTTRKPAEKREGGAANVKVGNVKVGDVEGGEITIEFKGEDGKTITKTIKLGDGKTGKTTEQPEGAKFIIGGEGGWKILGDAQEGKEKEGKAGDTKRIIIRESGEEGEEHEGRGVRVPAKIGEAREKEGPQGKTLLERMGVAAPEGRKNPYVKDGEKPKSSGLWIGVALEAEENGLEVEQVVPGSPAAKAGIAKGDIVLTVNGERAKTIEQMAEAVKKGQPIGGTLLHEGKERKFSVTPGKREEEANPRSPQSNLQESGAESKEARDLEARIKQLKAAINDAEQRAKPGQSVEFQIVHPGVVARGNRALLPEDVSVTITRQGSKPAKIVVKKGEQHWEADERNVSELPSFSLPAVMSMLGGAQGMPGGSTQSMPNTRQNPSTERRNPPGGSPQGTDHPRDLPGGSPQGTDSRRNLPGGSPQGAEQSRTAKASSAAPGGVTFQISGTDDGRPGAWKEFHLTPGGAAQSTAPNSLEALTRRIEKLEQNQSRDHANLERLSSHLQAQFGQHEAGERHEGGNRPAEGADVLAKEVRALAAELNKMLGDSKLSPEQRKEAMNFKQSLIRSGEADKNERGAAEKRPEAGESRNFQFNFEVPKTEKELNPQQRAILKQIEQGAQDSEKKLRREGEKQ